MSESKDILRHKQPGLQMQRFLQKRAGLFLCDSVLRGTIK